MQKKLISSLLSGFFMLNSFAQYVLVPYRINQQFGLSDTNGKLVLTPAYDNIYWKEGAWFETTSKITLNDTLEYAPGKARVRKGISAKLSGIIYNGVAIIKDEPFDSYHILNNTCVLAIFEGRSTNFTKEQFTRYGGDKRNFFSLFNLKGENLYPENFRRLQLMDTMSSSATYKNQARYILFFAQGFSSEYGLFVFDADAQRIAEWLVKDAYKIEFPRMATAAYQKAFVVTDKNRNRTHFALTNVADKYQLKEFLPEQTPALIERSGGTDKGLEDRMDMVVAEPPAVPSSSDGERSKNMKMPAFNPYFSFVKDSLFYTAAANQFKAVVLPPGTTVYRQTPNSMTQYQPVFVKHNSQFFIVAGNAIGSTAYDSLVYFGRYFMAWKKINGQKKAGVITWEEKEVLPFVYDSLFADIRYLDWHNQTPAAKQENYVLRFVEADAKYNYQLVYAHSREYSPLLTVFANNKCGVITIEGKTVIPIEYQMIARNKMQFSLPRVNEFIIVKKNNKYGIAQLEYDSKKKHAVLKPGSAPAVFEYIPTFYYPNYFSIKGFNLVGLYDKHMKFMGYATATGKAFYQQP